MSHYSPERMLMTKQLDKDIRVKKAVKQLRGLHKNLSEAELKSKAEELVNARDRENEIDIRSYFIDSDEQSLGVDLLRKYLNDYNIETISDRNTLGQLIYLEVLNKRLQKSLNDKNRDGKEIPDKLVETIHKNIKEIVNLKDKLGITKSKSQENVKDGYGYLQLVLKKYKVWLADNQANRYMICPCCGVSILMKIKTDVWEAQKHPFFKDRILGNEHLINLYKQQKLTQEDLALVFETSTDYIDWLVDKWGAELVPSKPKTKKDEVADFAAETFKDKLLDVTKEVVQPEVKPKEQ